uniref:Sterile alpha motif domain containing 11 n=1 Tax=Oryzias sinensis TaxID=183150 RepID=A0A8C8A1S5_9TELE
MSKGILQVHPPICDCPGCRISSPVNRGRLAEKRTIPLPPNRVPKKELASIFSSDDSEGSERASGDHAHIKQEDDLHYSIMRKSDLFVFKHPLFFCLCYSRDSDLSSIISSLHHSRQPGMPEGESASDHSTSTARTGRIPVVFEGLSQLDLCSSSLQPFWHSSSSFKNSESPVGEAGGTHSLMSPEEHYRRMMSALSEPGSYEEQQQRLYQLASSMGYGFLQPAQAEIFARQQELLRKQNLARLEMSAELLRQKELESLHQRQQQQRLLGHPLREELVRRSNAMLVLRHGAATPLLTLSQQQQQQLASSTPKETQSDRDMQSSSAGHDSESRKAARRDSQTNLCAGDHRGRESRERDKKTEVHNEDMNDSDSETDMCEERREAHGANPCLPSKPRDRERNRASAAFSGSLGGLFMDGEDSATANPAEDISKWSVEDVCGFISSLAGCAEYAQVFRDQAIDGETLPLLTEEHLLNTMGLKLGPALKIRSQVARRVGRLFYMAGFPFAFPLPPPATLRPPDRDREPVTASSDTPVGPTPGCSSPKEENGTGSAVVGRLEAKTPS